MKKLTLAFCILLAGSPIAHAMNGDKIVGNAETGKTKNTTCVACHMADGNSSITIYPKLAGQHPSYTIKQLQNFKAGKRQNPIMAPMAAALSDQDMADLAAYFAAQPIQPGQANEELVKQGQRIYLGGNQVGGVSACVSCHGPHGKGNPAAKYPVVGNQHADYIVKQLQDFKAGNRGAGTDDPNQIMMIDIASRMTEAEMKAVASYIQGLN
jgi:cytochrome c553